MKKVDFLRKKYPRFVYQDFNYKITNNNLEIIFNFFVEPSQMKPKMIFQPKILVKDIRPEFTKRLPRSLLANLIFNLGLIEIPSYWKATCSPIIEISAGYLNREQIKWWKDLIIKGMGQFFYENKIDFRKPGFLKIQVKNHPKFQVMAEIQRRFCLNKNGFLVAVGGGKDSIVTLEKLKEKGEEIGCFLVNPTKAMRKIVRVGGIKNSIIVKREIDPTLLELNEKGFLNGHTPITAVLSFLSVLTAVLFNYRNIAFSNEKSANEGNVQYLGKIINHQWSKSSEFERKFKDYCQRYLVVGINYFSFLRKYTELEIAKMFTNYPQYFSVFSSCNVVKTKKLKKRWCGTQPLACRQRQLWCGDCPKCLFTYATLYPFLEKKQLLRIFGRDLFENKKLLPAMKGLINPEIAKPFECVGTKKESQLAFKLSLEKAKKEGKIPYLLTRFLGLIKGRELR